MITSYFYSEIKFETNDFMFFFAHPRDYAQPPKNLCRVYREKIDSEKPLSRHLEETSLTVQVLILKHTAASRKADGKEKMKPAAEHTFSYVSRGLESSTQLAALSAAALTSWIVNLLMR